MAIPYGFEKMADGNVQMVTAKVKIVQRIYQRYVDGASLGGIADELEANQVVAPSGKIKWSRSVIGKILSNGKYVPYAVPMELFVAAQFGKDSRTNIQTNSNGSTQRKTTRYNSQNVLSAVNGGRFKEHHGHEHGLHQIRQDPQHGAPANAPIKPFSALGAA